MQIKLESPTEYTPDELLIWTHEATCRKGIHLNCVNNSTVNGQKLNESQSNKLFTCQLLDS